MAQIYKLILLSINILTLYGSLSASEKGHQDTAVCEEKCTKSFAPHTYPHGSDDFACKQGCRFYVIDMLLSSDKHNQTNAIADESNAVRRSCHMSCIDSYNETSSTTNACQTGCDSQELASSDKKEEQFDDEGIHLLKPVMQVREVVSKVVGLLRIIQSSVTTYFVGDNNELVAMREPVEIVVQVLPPDLVEREEKQDRKLKQEQPLHLENEGLMSSGATSIECFSKKVGVPPYLLIVSLVSFIIFLAYIFFIICSSGGKNKKMKSGMSIPAHALPVKLIRPEDLTKLSLLDEEDGQAPPLPIKVKIPPGTII